MFCPQCGTPLAEGSKVCPACNHTLKFIPKTPEVLDPNTPVSKTKYFLKVAPSEKKILCIVALVLGVLSVLSVILSANRTLNGSVFNLPIINFIGFVEDEDFSEGQKMIDEALEDAEDNIEELEEVAEDMFGISSKDIEDELGMSTKQFIKLFKPLSLNSTMKLIKAVGLDKVDDDYKYIRVVIAVINVIAIILVVLAGLGVLFQKTWLMVLSYIFSFFFVLITGGIFLWVMASVCFITTAVLFSKMKLEYKVYLAGFGIS
ncbi:MAG: zinc ribbon domain-containing protein [Clostridia bacterium]|nr:zinc ribbon domain-containing protein [Clostridia bacterium]